ncbi:MAG: GAF domain-containing protein [Chloroflexota bacterium]
MTKKGFQISTGGTNDPEPNLHLVQNLFHLTATLQCGAHTLDAVLQTLYAQLDANQLFGLVALLNENASQLEIHISLAGQPRSGSEDQIPEKIIWVPLEQAGSLRQVIQAQPAIFLGDAASLIEHLLTVSSQGPARDELTGLLQTLRSMPAICTRLGNEQINRGALCLSSPQLGAADIPIIEIFSRHVCVALENVRLFTDVQQVRNQYQGLAEACIDAIFLETLDGQILDCNPAACEIYGYSKEEFRALQVADLVPEDLVPHLPALIAEELMKGGILIEALNKRKDGSLFPVEVSTRLIQIGSQPRIVTYVHDISRRRRTEDTLLGVKEDLRHRADELSVLHAISSQIASQQDLQALLQTIVQQAARLLRCAGGGFYLCDPERREVTCAVSYNTPRDYVGVVLKYGEGAAGKVAQTGEPVIINDYRTWSGRAAVYDEDQPFRALISAPVIWQGQVTGVIHVLDFSSERNFSSEELELLTLFAAQAAAIIENARLLDSERQRRREAEMLRQATAALTSTLNLDELLDNILTRLEEVVKYESATVFLLEGKHLLGKAARGLARPENVLGHLFPAEDILFQEVQRSRQPLILKDAQVDPRFNRWGATEHIRGWMGIPMIVQNQVIGHLTCDSSQYAAYSDHDAALALGFANQAAIAIHTARLFKAENDQLVLARTLQEVSALLTSQLSLDEVLQNILELLKRVVQYDSVSIHLLDEDNRTYLAAGAGFTDIERTRQIVSEASDYMLKSKWSEHKVRVIPDTYASDHWQIIPGTEHIRSWVGAPLLVKGAFIGSLNLDCNTPHAYDKATGETVMAFANQAAIAIANARLFEAERKRVAELEILRQASISLTASLELPQVLDSILRKIMDLLPGAQNGHIFLYDDVESRLTFGAALWGDGSSGRPWSEPRQNGLTYTVARQGEMIVVPDMRTHPMFANAPSEWQGAIVGLPLRIGPRVIGVMNVSFSRPHRIPDSELRVLRLLGDQASIAIENANLYNQAATERRHMGLLYDISRELSSSLDSGEILRRTATLTNQVLGSLICEAFLYDPESERLELRATAGDTTLSPLQADVLLKLSLGKGLAGWVAQHRQAANVAEVVEDHRWFFAAGIDENVRSALSAPIIAGENLLGVLSVLHDIPNAFSEEHVFLLKAITQEVALALSNAHRYQQVQRRLAELTLIQSLTQTFNQRLGVQALLDEVVNQLRLRLGYNQISIYLIEAGHMVLKACHGLPPQQQTLPLSRGIIGRVARTAQAALVNDVASDPDYCVDTPDTVAELAVPIFQDTLVVGIICIESDRSDLLTPQDRDLLEVLAGQISVALENASLYEQVRNHAQELELTVAQRTAELTELYKLSQEIGYSLSYEDLLELLLDHLRMAIHCEVVLGYLRLENFHQLSIDISRPLAANVLPDLRALCVRVLDQASHTSLPRQENLAYMPDFEPNQPGIHQLQSLIQAPVLLDQQIVGVLAIASEGTNAFSTAQEHLLTTFANQASAAMQRLSALLTAQQRQLESLVEHLPVGVLLLDPDFRILVSNPVGQAILSQMNAEIDHSDNRLKQLGPHTLQEFVARQDEPLPVEIVLEGQPNCIIATQIRPAGISPAGEPHSWILMLNDITQERENLARIQIQERLATVGQLAAGIAHDFNNIMAAILVYTDLLRYDQTISANSQEKLAIIQQQVQRASSLIRQILDFSRKSVMEQSHLDLLPLVKELDKMLVRILPETIRLELSYEPGNYWVEGDPTRLQQVFMNLAVNARDAMPEGGVLHFELSCLKLESGQTPPSPEMIPGDWVRIIVHDSGVGITPEVKDHLFEPFFTTKPIGQGTGLGLAQVYGIVKQHAGHIDVFSQSGQGTTFIIYLPALPTATEEHKEPDPERPLRGQGQMVLVAEDDEATRVALQALLEVYNYTTLIASNGAEALKLFESHQSSIVMVISDLVMPQMGGLALFQVLQKRQPGIKMLMITGHPVDEDNQALLEKGQVHWLQKPFTIQGFNRAIETLLSSS